VDSDLPAELRISRLALTVLRADLGRALPEEGCGLLLGLIDGPRWRIRRIWPCRNSWEPLSERAQRFAIDPREQLLAQRWSRQHGWQVLGSAHSHPTSEPVPSAIDRQLAFVPTLMLILGPAAGAGGTVVPGRPAESAGAAAGPGWVSEPELAAWWLAGDGQPGGPCRRLGWRMED
jgi:proteasome lid subunit RPN8/RPN11